jgi:GT2 family glycosyltransferase
MEERLASDAIVGRLSVLDLATNQGFTGGVNQAARRALSDGHEWILLLNNDAVLGPGALAALRRVRGPSIAAACPAIVDEASGRVSALGGNIAWSRGLTRDRHHGERIDDLPGRPESVDFGTGAGLLLSAEALRKVGLLDETYFAYWEETDWCTRARRAGFTIRTCPEAIVVHRGGASSDPASRLYLLVRNCLIFMRRHARRRDFVTFLPVFILWTIPLWSTRPALSSPLATVSAVCRAVAWHLKRPRLPPPLASLSTSELPAR